MPRISDSLTLNKTTFNAVRPQNGETPASFREAGTKPLVEQAIVNMGASIEKTASRHVFRGKVAIVKPNAIVNGIQAPAHRIDVTSRLGSELTDSDIAELLEVLKDLVGSTEFAALIRGQEQY